MDYGLAYRYCPEGVHKVYKEDPKRCHDGTIEYTSIDAHKGVGKDVKLSNRLFFFFLFFMCYAGIFLFFHLLTFTNCIFNVTFLTKAP